MGAILFNIFFPPPLHGIKRQQMRGSGDAAFDFVQMHHVQAVACTRVIAGAIGCAKRRTQGQTPNPTHAIDADSHVGCSNHYFNND
jgi:hypothetical protein